MSANDGAMMARKPASCERPRRVLARRAASRSSRPRRGSARASKSGRLSGKSSDPWRQSKNRNSAEAGALDALEELLRDDLIGVDVGAVERRDRPRDDRRSAPSDELPARRRRRPVTAAAAAISGLIRCVRPPAPWRPSKLRFDVEAQRSLGPEDVGVHAEAHRAARVAPLEAGVGEDRSRPSASASALTRIEPGHDHRAHAARRRACRARPSAAARRSAQPAVRARADEDAVDRDVPASARCRPSGPCSRARAARPRRAARGRAPVIGAIWPGFVPQVTCGASAETSTTTSRSNVAPASVR